MALLTKNNTEDDNKMALDFHFPTSKKALIIFTRNPELGKVKTRLAKTIGDASALNIYNFLLKHTVKITKELAVDKFVFYSEAIHRDDIWDTAIFRKKLQAGNDLGKKMENAFSDIFAMGYEQAIIIGSDMYDLDKTDLETAFNTLQTKQTVIGPATDGGYYLLGMKELNAKIFKNKDWGNSTVLKDTLADLENEKYILLDERNDVDYYEDIKDETVFQQFLPPHLVKSTA